MIDGENGVLVDEHDIDGMEEQMCRILAQPEQARVMGAAGRRRIREHFTMARSIDQLNHCVTPAMARAGQQGSVD